MADGIALYFKSTEWRETSFAKKVLPLTDGRWKLPGWDSYDWLITVYEQDLVVFPELDLSILARVEKAMGEKPSGRMVDVEFRSSRRHEAVQYTQQMLTALAADHEFVVDDCMDDLEENFWTSDEILQQTNRRGLKCLEIYL